MSDLESLWESFATLVDEDRLAHAYLLEGDPSGAAWTFAWRLVERVYASPALGGRPELARLAIEGHHPDVAVVEPESKSRQITVDQIDAQLHRLHQTAYEGGWKVLLIRYAELMNPATANKFLKTLEEPPANILLLLVVDHSEGLLDTIRSRCQLVRIGGEADTAQDAYWRAPLDGVLQAGWGRSLHRRLAGSEDLQAVLELIKQRATEEVEAGFTDEDEPDKKLVEARIASRYKAEVERVCRALVLWCRDLLLVKLELAGDGVDLVHPGAREALETQAADLSVRDCYRLIERAEALAHRALRTNLPLQSVVDTAYL